jgi:hypothetical protein
MRGYWIVGILFYNIIRIIMLKCINTCGLLDDTVQLITYKAHSLCLALSPEDEDEGDLHGD